MTSGAAILPVARVAMLSLKAGSAVTVSNCDGREGDLVVVASPVNRLQVLRADRVCNQSQLDRSLPVLEHVTASAQTS